MQFIGSLICVILLTLSAILEKSIAHNHHYMHLSLSRIVYMLLITCIVIIILYPQEFTSKHFVKSLLDYNVILIGVFTAIGMLLYYWLLTKMDLYMVSLIWIVIILLVLIISFMYFKENINMIQWFGIALAIIGLSLIFIYKNN